MLPPPRRLARSSLAASVIVAAALGFAAPPRPGAAAACPAGQDGWFGWYYNLSEDDPGMSEYRGRHVPNSVVGAGNPWYQEQYLAFSRVDHDINVGLDYFPLDAGKKGDPFFFAIHWRAVAVAPTKDTYRFALRSDDDSWLLIDGRLVVNDGGIHGANDTVGGRAELSAGRHTFDIYYAERGRRNSFFTMQADPRLTFCASMADEAPARPALPYTPAVALYRAPENRDVYAIYANGQRHYVSGPTAFARYGYRFPDVRTVPQHVLALYPDAWLLRAPRDPAVYYLVGREQGRWMKIVLPSPDVFLSYPGNGWGNVAVVDQIDLDRYPNVRLIRPADTADIYLLADGGKRLVGDLAAAVKLGYRGDEVVTVSPAHFDAYPTREPVAPPAAP